VHSNLTLLKRKRFLSFFASHCTTPSWAKFTALGSLCGAGETLEKIKADYLYNYKNHVSGGPDISRPTSWPQACIDRRNQLAPDMKRDCGEAAAKEFGALKPKHVSCAAVIFLCLDKTLSQWSLFDLGAFQQSIMLAAFEYGLGTIPAITLVHFRKCCAAILRFRSISPSPWALPSATGMMSTPSTISAVPEKRWMRQLH
jgi:hypothetical protein